tara:strand:- start:540 stop:746 length:207 start_codon:yes stop_codon:yes gene_type:complete
MESIKTEIPLIKEETVSLDVKRNLLIVGTKSYTLEKGVLSLVEALMYENNVLKEYIEIVKGIDVDTIA